MENSLVRDIELAAQRGPDSPALSWRTAVWSYGDLVRAIRCAAAKIRAHGVEPGSRVVVLLRNSPEYAAVYYGTLAAGCAAVPLNVQERAPVLLRQIEHVECSLIVTDPGHPEWPAIAAGLGEDRRVLTVTPRDEGDSCATFCRDMGAVELETESASPADDLAMIIYTSGTTANPKGVMLSHRSLCANARSIAGFLEIVPSDKVICVLPFHFSYGTSVLNSNLLAGSHLLLEDNFAFPLMVLQRMESEGVTALPGVPSTFALMLAQDKLADYDLGRLRYVTQAGGAMPRAHIEQLRERLAAARLFIMYGQTEATARVTYLDPAMLGEKIGSVGRPLEGTEIEIRTEEAVLPAGETGEICVRGPGVMLGYWRAPELTAKTVRDEWLHTGDLGHFDEDGYLYIDGRAVDMIKVGAYRVSPQEVEEVIATYQGVAQVGVTAVPDPLLGQAIKAVVVPNPGCDIAVRELKAHCRKHLANYKVPKLVDIADSLPRTSSGKIQRFKLG